MKEKTSITLSSDILAKVDRVAGSKFSRSAFIEHVLRKYFRERSRRKMHARDLERINAAADRLNFEAAEVLEYQAQLIEEGFLHYAGHPSAAFGAGSMARTPRLSFAPLGMTEKGGPCRAKARRYMRGDIHRGGGGQNESRGR